MALPTASPSSPFRVTGRRRNGTITYLCPTPEWALRKLADFERAGYAEIVATGPDDRAIAEHELSALAQHAEIADVDPG